LALVFLSQDTKFYAELKLMMSEISFGDCWAVAEVLLTASCCTFFDWHQHQGCFCTTVLLVVQRMHLPS